LNEVYYVQVRYPAGNRWVAGAVSDDRRAAERLAPGVLRYLKNDRGRAPAEVRIVSLSDLIVEGGEDALERARADLRERRQWNR
jgi:hypothetical protein